MLDADGDGAVEVLEGEEPDEPDDGPVVFAREIRPPLRRWAAGRAVRSDAACWSALVQRVRQVDPRGGAAIVHGLVDNVELLTPAARELLLDLVASWPHRKLREAATALRRAPEPLHLLVRLPCTRHPSPRRRSPRCSDLRLRALLAVDGAAEDFERGIEPPLAPPVIEHGGLGAQGPRARERC